MPYYELFQSGPLVFVLVLVLSLGITLLAYGAFPIIFAKTRKKPITKKKYNLLCYGINFFMVLLFIAFNGKSSGAPYLLWTSIFSLQGLNILKKRGVLNDFQSKKSENIHLDQGNSGETEEIRFCRKCGNRMLDNARFCSLCGTEIVSEE